MLTRLAVFPLALALAACGPAPAPTPDAGEETPDAGGGETGPTAVDVTADITADTTWTANKVYTLKQHVFIRTGTLTVEAGTRVLGGEGTSLVATKTGRLVAVGTADKPIVFTSANDEGDRSPGNWGGLVLLGSAKVNAAGGTRNVEGFPDGTTGVDYGGNDDTHDCGRLEYVRIEFAGFELSKDNELNGLTLGACGNRTVLDHVQVHKGADDGIEFFGGTVDVKHLLVTQPDDDGIDWDYGWTGRGQFLVVQQNASVGNFAIEADSNPNDPAAQPRSQPVLYNVTLVGSDRAPATAGKLQGAINFRRGTAGHLYNVILAHFTDHAIEVSDAATGALATAGDLFVKNSIFFDNGDLTDTFPADIHKKDPDGNDLGENDGGWDEGAFFLGESTVRKSDPQLTDATNLLKPDFSPKAGSPARTGAATPPSTFFDDTATFVGAVGSSDWTTGWTAFPAN